LSRYHASWVLPIAGPPIRDGWVDVDGGRIVAVGQGGPSTADSRDCGRVAILPGLVNAHTHLELSHLRDRIAPSASFTDWARQIIYERRQQPQLHGPDIMTAIDAAIGECLQSGTAVVGDISNTLAPFGPLAASPLAGVVFWEIIGFKIDKPDELIEHALSELKALPATDRVRLSLSAHAPYSVSPPLFQSIKQAVARMPFAPCSVHLAENIEEVELLKTGGGPWKALMKDIGAWNHEWHVPGVGPVQYLDDLGFIDGRLLAVHGVQMSSADLARLKQRGSTLVTCPRSNVSTGAGVPPVAAFYRSGVRVAVGTDSLASTPDLNLFSELAELRRLAPGVPASQFLDSATRQGARALGFDADYGAIEPGKRARLLAVSVPERVDDVEEYLVSGIRPAQLAWLDTGSRVDGAG
jgi:aminodeoxyfutalosine deaminase